MKESKILQVVPVLSSSNISRDIEWYQKYAGFYYIFGDSMYSGIQRGNFVIHLQWHANSNDDPCHASVVKFFVDSIIPIYREFKERRTIDESSLCLATNWNTNEFAFYDLNRNGIFFVEDIVKVR